jgi:hypothetical protein
MSFILSTLRFLLGMEGETLRKAVWGVMIIPM